MSRKKPKTVYKEDDGRTLYSMAGLEGKTPEQLDAEYEQRKKAVRPTRKERRAMIAAAFQVYGPILLIVLLAFGVVAVGLYLAWH